MHGRILCVEDEIFFFIPDLILNHGSGSELVIDPLKNLIFFLFSLKLGFLDSSASGFLNSSCSGSRLKFFLFCRYSFMIKDKKSEENSSRLQIPLIKPGGSGQLRNTG